ncbi:MAG: mercuric reductase [Thermoleophilia bacterium]
MTATERYDAIVIGAGQAGVPLAIALAKAGLSTAIVEREHVAGTCVNEGCTPTKTMVASARVAHVARRAERYGVGTGPVSVDMARVRQRKRDIVTSWRAGSEGRIQAVEGLELIMGEARFTGPRSLEVRLLDGGSRRLTAERIIINAGARPSVPDLPGLADVPYLNSTSVMELDAVPEHLIVLGGGYVAVEFAQMFSRFGSAVTIVQRGGQLLGREDPDIAAEVASVLRESGVQLLLESAARSVRLDDHGRILLTVDTPEGPHTVNGSHLLVAVGRTPNSDTLDLAAAGIETDGHGFIITNNRLETGAPGVYAAGDIKGGPAFTHISYDDFRVLRSNLLEGGSASIADRLVPYTVFMDPELGRVGLTETEARVQGRRLRVAKMPMAWVARALEMEETQGVMKAVVDGETDQILGAAILGVAGGELVAILQVAMMGGIPAARLRETVFTHPTLAESLNNLFANWQEAAPGDSTPSSALG